MVDYGISGQTDRRRQLYELYLAHTRGAVDGHCKWHGRGQEPSVREKLWHCLALLSGSSDDIALANRIIAAAPQQRCHFSPMTAMQLLLKYESSLTSAVVARLEDYVKASLPLLARDALHYTMYNDNFAGMAVFTLLTAGERFGDSAAFSAGTRKLRGLKEVLTRNGTIMEYGSPTYTVVDLHPLAEVVSYVRDPDMNELAQRCEERMWAEIATHYHAPTSLLAGPYSRAYAIDMVAHPHQFCYVMYLVFGDAVFINPVADLFMPRENQVVHVGLDTLMWPGMVWLVSGDYHCPDYLADVLLNKQFPYTVVTKSECIPSRIEGYRTDEESGKQHFVKNILEFAGFSGPNTTYMTEDYALGTAYSQFHDGGLSESFYVVYRKKQPARDLADTGVVFSKYIINDKVPEKENTYSVYGESGKEGFRDEGRKFGMQQGACSMMVYKPKQFEAHAVTSMKLSIMFPCHFGFTHKIMLGNELLTTAHLAPSADTREILATSQKPCPVYVNDGPVYMAFKPLTLTDHGRKAAVKIEQTGNFLSISFYNYEGPRRSFEVEEMLTTSSGFIAHLGNTGEFESFDSFVAAASLGTLSDYTTSQQGSVTRWIRYSRDDVDMHFAYSPLSEGIMIDTLGGRPRPRPVFEATGLDTHRLPFLEH